MQKAATEYIYLKLTIMEKRIFDKLSADCQLEVAENFKDNGITKGTYGAGNADERYRRDENGLEEMEDPSQAGGFDGGKGK